MTSATASAAIFWCLRHIDMILTIKHETVYRYTAPLSYTIQQLRMTPRAEAHQQVMSWDIKTQGRRNSFSDAYGNLCEMLTITGQHNEVRILANGVVDVSSLKQGRLFEKDLFSPLIFTVPTILTASTDSVAEFSARYLKNDGNAHDFLALAEAICGSVLYQTGATMVSSTASDALLLGQGVCQDHAHLFLACCHFRGIPARYVSGYIDPGTTDHAASHAWVDVWTDEADFTGWVSIDVTHARFQDNAYCRLGIARDYASAAPTRGMRRGGGDESMEVRVHIETGQ